jgi:dTDP-4-dehydrorhamnose 3,5-epimerase
MQKPGKSNQLGRTIKVNSVAVDGEPYIVTSPIEGVVLIKRPRYADDRGSFQELFRTPDIKKLFRKTEILQAQISVSKVNVLRGIHAEPRDKVITPISGRMSAIIVDLRTESPTYKKWVRFDFDNTQLENPYATLFVPSGCGNSLCVYKERGDPGNGTLVYYYTYSEVYDPKWSDSGVKFDEPALKITWPIKKPIVSERDKNLLSLSEFVKKYR